jgi:hypothetical protein
VGPLFNRVKAMAVILHKTSNHHEWLNRGYCPNGVASIHDPLGQRHSPDDASSTCERCGQPGIPAVDGIERPKALREISGFKSVHAFADGETVVGITTLGHRLFVATTRHVYEMIHSKLVLVEIANSTENPNATEA